MALMSATLLFFNDNETTMSYLLLAFERLLMIVTSYNFKIIC